MTDRRAPWLLHSQHMMSLSFNVARSIKQELISIDEEVKVYFGQCVFSEKINLKNKLKKKKKLLSR